MKCEGGDLKVNQPREMVFRVKANIIYDAIVYYNVFSCIEKYFFSPFPTQSNRWSYYSFSSYIENRYNIVFNNVWLLQHLIFPGEGNRKLMWFRIDVLIKKKQFVLIKKEQFEKIQGNSRKWFRRCRLSCSYAAI